MENMKIKKSVFIEKLHKNWVLQANRKSQERANFQAWLLENAENEHDEMRKERARRFAAEVEERLGFAYTAKILELQRAEDEAEFKFILAMILLMFTRLPNEQKIWLKNESRFDDQSGGLGAHYG